MADCFDNISFSDDETLPNFSLFPELDSDVSSDKQENIQEKAEHEQDDSSQEIDDFILAERATNTVKKTINDFKKFEKKLKKRPYNKHLINLVCSFRTVIYLPSFFHGPRAALSVHKKNSGT